MVVAISDLHLQDFSGEAITAADGSLIHIDRKVPAEAFREFFTAITAFARTNSARELIIVFAGDVFELHRSRKWMQTEIRPYGKHSPGDVKKIAREVLASVYECNSDVIEIIQTFADQTRINGTPVRFIYLPGNHDRLINLDGELGQWVRIMLGNRVANGWPFHHYYQNDDYGLLVIHGHEYDASNFSRRPDNRGVRAIDPHAYDEPAMGDYTTIDVASAFAYEFRLRHEDQIKVDPVYQEVYRRLLEFDDLRPETEIAGFLQATVNGSNVWDLVAPVAETIIERGLDDDFLTGQIRKKTWVPLFLVKGFLENISTKMATSVLTGMGEPKVKPCQYALHDPFLNEESARYIVAGHSHVPSVEFLRKTRRGESFFFDLGTWRQQIRRCVDGSSFAKAKALTYAVFYREDEDNAAGSEKRYSFDYWSGMTKKEVFRPVSNLGGAVANL